MKKSLILLALGLFAAAAFAQTIPPDAAKTKPNAAFKELVGEGQTDYESYNKVVQALKAIEAERDALKAQLTEVSNAANIFKAQRNEMASQVMDLSAQVQLLRTEIDRLKQQPKS